MRELYEQIVPYRHNRRELAIETNDDYETAVARLLSGERNYVTADPAMQESLQRELASPTGDPGVFKDYANATLTLTAAAGIGADTGASDGGFRDEHSSVGIGAAGIAS